MVTAAETEADINRAMAGRTADSKRKRELQERIDAGTAWEGMTAKQFRRTYNARSPAELLRSYEKRLEQYSTIIRSGRERLSLIGAREAEELRREALVAQGVPRSQARRKAQSYTPSTTSRLQYLASKGDEEAAEKLKAKARFLGRGRFATRKIPKFDGPTTGKAEGSYISPLTGREVIIRAGGNLEPTYIEGSSKKYLVADSAKYTEVPAGDVWSRDYTLRAKIKDLSSPDPNAERPAGIAKVPTSPAGAPSPGTYPLASATVPVTIVPERPAANFQGTGQPAGTGTTINVPRYFVDDIKNTVTEFKRPTIGGDPGDIVGFGKLRSQEFVTDLKAGDYTGAASAGFQAFSYKFAGGLMRTGRAFVEQPAESALTLGVYAGSTIAGPAGPATVFATQNVYEASKGETPTIVRAVTDPITFAGEMSPFIAYGAVRSARANVKAAKLQAEIEGTVVTTKTADLVAERLPSAELRVQPLEAVETSALTVDSRGLRTSVGVSKPILGEHTYLTAKEIAAQPAAFLTNTQVKKIVAARPTGEAPPGPTIRIVETGPVRVTETPAGLGPEVGGVETRFNVPGRASAAEVASMGEQRINAVRFDKSASRGPLASYEVVETTTTFQGYEPPAAWELVTKPAEAGAKPGPRRPTEAPRQFGRVGIEKKGGQVGYEPKLDFYEEFALETPEGLLKVRESPYTGAREATITPFIVREVTAPPKAPAAPPPAKAAKKATEIEIENPDGTVTIQKVEAITTKPLKQETVSLQETKSKSLYEQKTATAKQAAQAKPDQRFKIITKQQSGKPYDQAIIKFKGNTRSALYPAVSLTSFSTGTGTAAVSGLSAAVSPAQAQETAAIVDTIQLPAQAVAQATAQDQAQATGQALSSWTGTPQRPRTPRIIRERTTPRYIIPVSYTHLTLPTTPYV